jgi:hypothetical protein
VSLSCCQLLTLDAAQLQALLELVPAAAAAAALHQWWTLFCASLFLMAVAFCTRAAPLSPPQQPSA